MDENSLKIATNDPRSFPLRFLLARTCVCAQSCVVAVISIRRGIRAFFPFALHSLLINIPLLENHRTNEICLRIACLKKKPSKRKKISLWTIDRSFPLLRFHAPCLIFPHHFSSSRSVSIFIYFFFKILAIVFHTWSINNYYIVDLCGIKFLSFLFWSKKCRFLFKFWTNSEISAA